MKKLTYEDVLKIIRAFRDERAWMRYHDPKNLALSLMIEAAELLEHFQWKDKAEVEKYVKTRKQPIAEELADVAAYLFELADILHIDLLQAMARKMKKNAKKYPVKKSRGQHTKYDKFPGK